MARQRQLARLAEKVAPAAASNCSSGVAHVLLIDDDELVRETLGAALVQAGYAVTLANDGRQGLKLFRNEPADIVITDVVMPDGEGIGVLIELTNGFPEVPIIVMSGHPANSALYLDIAKKLGARRTLSKPFAPEAILLAVEELLRESGDRTT